MTRYSAAEALRQILVESDNDDKSVSCESDDSTDEDHLSEEKSSDSDNSSTSTIINDQDEIRCRGRGRGRSRTGARRGSRGTRRATYTQQEDTPVETNEEMLSKSGRKWSRIPPVVHRRGPQDIIRNPPGIRKESISVKECTAFHKVLTPEILDIVMRETNREAERVYASWNNEHTNNQKPWKMVSINELNAFIGLLITAGAYRARMEPLDDLWSDEHGISIFFAVMSKERFKSLLRFIHFDNKATREQRRLLDRLAAFRDVWEMFNAKLCSLFVPGSDITVDEQLVAFRGKCPFRQYIRSKPAKYGIKVWWACDAQTCFPLQGQVYLGRQPGTDRDINQGARVVKDVTKHWLKSGRNIVMDNFFTSVPLAEELLYLHTTVVGTIRKNKPDIPKLMTETKNRPENSTIFGFCRPLKLASYVPKKNKLVTVLSTMHHDEQVGGEKLKPAIILHYNANKSGVDNMDKVWLLHLHAEENSTVGTILQPD